VQHFLFFCLGLLCLHASHADQPSRGDQLSHDAPHAFGLGAQQLIDDSRQLTLSQVRQRQDWQPTQAEHPNFGYTDAAIWYQRRVTLTEQPLWLWIRYSLLDRVDLYVCPPHSNNAGCEHQASGDSLTFNNRAVKHADLLLPIKGQGEVELFLRVHNEGTHQLPAWLLPDDEMHDSLQSYNLLRGGFLAALLVMGLYNLFIFVTTRDRSYLLYSGFVLSFLLLHMTYEGSAFQFLWPQWPVFNEYALPLFFGLNQLAMCAFVSRFLRLAEYSPIMHGAFSVYASLAALSMLLSLAIPYGWALAFQNLLSTFISVSALACGLRLWRRGETAARYFSIAWLVFIVGMVITNVRSLGWLPTTTFTLFSYQLGSFIEIILLSMALGERIARLQRNELAARQQRLQSQEQAIHYLRSFEELYHNSLSGQFQLDEQGRFTKSNPSWRRMLGLAHCDTERLPPFGHLFHASAMSSFWHTLKQDEQVQRYVLERGHDEQRSWLSITMRRRRQGELAGSNTVWIGSAQDVTRQYQHELDVRRIQEEKTRSLRQLVMGVAHEMNTPLGNIQMAQSFLAENIAAVRDDDLRLQLQAASQHIDQGVIRLKDLNQVMKNSALVDEQPSPELIQLQHWFSHWRRETLRLDPELALTITVDTDVSQWQGNSDALERVLNQLLDNSLRHNPQLASNHKLTIDVQVSQQAQLLSVHYQDNGCGIAANERELVFLPFYTTRRQQAGSCGLGLYESYNLVTQVLNGTIQWGDGPGFDLRLLLPVEAQANTEAAPALPV
jgi:signal transduction histidine kinase